MGPRALFFVVLLACLGTGGPALADHALPPPLPEHDRQTPEREQDALVRRPVEAHVAATTAWLGCSGSAPRAATVADPCASLGAAFGLQASLLYRPTPHASVGVSGLISRFSWDASRVFSETSGAASTPGETAATTSANGRRRAGEGSWSAAGVTGRASFLEEGRFDPWLAGFAGIGFLSMRGSGDQELTRVGFLTQASLGLDVWLTGRWKLTSQVEAAWQPGDAAERCEGGTCLDGGTLARVPGRSLGAGLGVAVALGDPL